MVSRNDSTLGHGVYLGIVPEVRNNILYLYCRSSIIYESFHYTAGILD